jgi:hypothetical protein
MVGCTALTRLVWSWLSAWLVRGILLAFSAAGDGRAPRLMVGGLHAVPLAGVGVDLGFVYLDRAVWCCSSSRRRTAGWLDRHHAQGHTH